MQSHFDAIVTGGKGNSPFKMNIPKATAEIQALEHGDVVKVTIEKVSK